MDGPDVAETVPVKESAVKFARIALLGLCLVSVATADDDSAPRKIGSVEGFKAFVDAERRKYAELVKVSGAKVD